MQEVPTILETLVRSVESLLLHGVTLLPLAIAGSAAIYILDRKSK